MLIDTSPTSERSPISKIITKSARSFSLAGFTYAILAGLAFGAMSFLVHISSSHTPSGELVFLRALFSLLMISPFLSRKLPDIFSRRAGFLWLRCLAGSLAMLAFYWTLQHTTVGRSTALAHLAPVFVVPLSWKFFGEKINLREAVAIGLGITGVLTLFMRGESSASAAVILIGLCGGLSAAIANVSLRQATAAFSPMAVVWTFSLVMIALSLIVPGSSWTIPAVSTVLPIAGICVTGLAGQILLTWSYMYLKAPVASALGLSSLVFGVVFESGFYRRLPGAREILSYLLIISGVCLLQLMQRRQSSAAPGLAKPGLATNETESALAESSVH